MDSFCLETGSDHAVPPGEDDSVETVELFKVDIGRRVERDDADDAGLDLWWWAERIARDFHDVVDFGVELDVGGESTPEGRTGSSYQAKCKLALEHEDGAAREGTGGEQLEYDGR